ncbi:MAG: histidine phosphatase family protein [Chloroflexota bacterium]
MQQNELRASLPTTIMMVRHATVHNPRGILYGRLPHFGLSKEGREQAARVARFLASRPVTAIYASPLLRARQTADIVAGLQPAAARHSSSLLLESRTSYQGEPNSVLKKGFSFYEPRHAEDDESMQDIFDRISRFLRIAARRHAGETIVAVSHADPITVMRVGLEGRSMTSHDLHAVLYPARASVTQLVLFPDQPFTMSYFNVAGVQEEKL